MFGKILHSLSLDGIDERLKISIPVCINSCSNQCHGLPMKWMLCKKKQKKKHTIEADWLREHAKANKLDENDSFTRCIFLTTFRLPIHRVGRLPAPFRHHQYLIMRIQFRKTVASTTSHQINEANTLLQFFFACLPLWIQLIL